ncbi:MAG: hypothetical protein FWD62_08080, partial [Betaproteobacteria bacterium]|nr:hypothetical protein [Betaproteobacteria bacterium]
MEAGTYKPMTTHNKQAPFRGHPLKPTEPLRRPARRALVGLACLLSLSGLSAASASDLSITIPNGFADLSTEDLGVQSSAGRVRWKRLWDGQEWKFNPHWESLSQSWKNLTGSEAGDTTGGTLNTASGITAATGGSLAAGCWVWVD